MIQCERSSTTHENAMQNSSSSNNNNNNLKRMSFAVWFELACKFANIHFILRNIINFLWLIIFIFGSEAVVFAAASVWFLYFVCLVFLLSLFLFIFGEKIFPSHCPFYFRWSSNWLIMRTEPHDLYLNKQYLHMPCSRYL